MHPINLTRAWIARGVADREAKLARALLHQLVDEGALADAGRACDDDGDGFTKTGTERFTRVVVHECRRRLCVNRTKQPKRVHVFDHRFRSLTIRLETLH